jgi:hypothetical protein
MSPRQRKMFGLSSAAANPSETTPFSLVSARQQRVLHGEEIRRKRHRAAARFIRLRSSLRCETPSWGNSRACAEYSGISLSSLPMRKCICSVLVIAVTSRSFRVCRPLIRRSRRPRGENFTPLRAKPAAIILLCAAACAGAGLKPGKKVGFSPRPGSVKNLKPEDFTAGEIYSGRPPRLRQNTRKKYRRPKYSGRRRFFGAVLSRVCRARGYSSSARACRNESRASRSAR